MKWSKTGLIISYINSLMGLSRKSMNLLKTLYIVVKVRADPKIMGLNINGKYFVKVFLIISTPAIIV
jgi:hypothetical protein